MVVAQWMTLGFQAGHGAGGLAGLNLPCVTRVYFFDEYCVRDILRLLVRLGNLGVVV